MENNHFNSEDKNCPHCGGNISAHCEDTVIMYWCDYCGANNKKIAPNIEITFSN